MPDDLDLPDWVSEPSTLPHHEVPVARRADLRRAAEQQRRAGARRAASPNSSTARHGQRPAGRPGSRPAARPEQRDPVTSRADRRRAEQGAARRSQPGRPARLVEMVPPPTPDSRLRTQRHAPGGRRRAAPSPAIARRRLGAALVLMTCVALTLWAIWPSGETSGPARATADLTAVAVAGTGSDPIAAAEDLPPSPTIAPTPGSTTAPSSGTGKVTSVVLPAIAAPTVNPTRTVRVGLQVEDGSGVDGPEAAEVVARTLGDPRGWQDKDRVRFRAMSPADTASGNVDITIVMASPDLTDELCRPLRTNGRVSCFNGRKVVLNARRWTEGVAGYGKDLAAYRQYMVNHEVGHGLYHGHVECPSKDALAPIMLQQTKGLDGCRPNAWPTQP